MLSLWFSYLIYVTYEKACPVLWLRLSAPLRRFPAEMGPWKFPAWGWMWVEGGEVQSAARALLLKGIISGMCLRN